MSHTPVSTPPFVAPLSFTDADAESLPPALADHYLQLKATGQL